MFVSFEGGDGVGKTSLAKSLHALFAADRPTALLERRSPIVVDPYVSSTLGHLSRVLWPNALDEPQYRMGDEFYLQLSTAWFGALEKHVVRPALDRGESVIIDGWYFKTLARARLRPHIRAEPYREIFERLSRPTHVVRVRLSAKVAFDRKGSVSNAEAGVNDGLRRRDAASFAVYQERLSSALDQELGGLQILEVGGAVDGPDETARRLAAALLRPSADHCRV